MPGQAAPQMIASSLSAQAPQMFDGPMVPVTVTFRPHRHVRVWVTGLMSYMTVTSSLGSLLVRTSRGTS
jgi:hypothetical protein